VLLLLLLLLLLCSQDDDLAVDFVTAASNLRSACYGIPQQSAFDVKVRAGFPGTLTAAAAAAPCVHAGCSVKADALIPLAVNWRSDFSFLAVDADLSAHHMPCSAVLQGMAGNIIHAIATTNAIVGGIIVSEALKILAGGPHVVLPLHQHMLLRQLICCQLSLVSLIDDQQLQQQCAQIGAETDPCCAVWGVRLLCSARGVGC
jgi:hypothetical protein